MRRQCVNLEGRLTAGLKSPPLTRKKIQTLTASENPNASEMYINDPISISWLPRRLLAVCVAAKAKKRNRKVPMNSPKKARSRWRVLFGSHRSARSSPGRAGSSVYVGFIFETALRLCAVWGVRWCDVHNCGFAGTILIGGRRCRKRMEQHPLCWSDK